MLLLPNHATVLNAFAALANAAPGKANFDYHVSYIKDFGVAGYSSALNQIFAGVTDRDLAALILDNLGLGGVFTLDVAESFIAANAADRIGAVLSLSNALYNYKGSDAAVVAAKNAYVSKVDYSFNYSAVQGNVASSNFPSSYEVNTFVLSAGVETLIGSAANDVFKGITPDALSSGDVLHGGAGNDLLDAVLAFTPHAIRAVTTGIETVAISAQSSYAYSNGDNNINQQQVTVDAHEMQGVTTWENNNSRADLIVEDVRIASNQITKDITVAMVETDPGSVDYGVYFDQLSLRTTTNATSQLNLQVMDTASVVAGTAPLLNSPYRGFKFTVTDANGVGGVVTLESDAIDAAQTYAELAAAFQAAADAQFGAGVVTVSVGKDYTATDTTTGTVVSGKEITISAAGAFTFTTPTGSGWVAAGVVPANSGLHTNFNTAASSSTDLVTVKVILDDVGRGSTGGDLVIGGLSTGTTSTSKGVERFEIRVDDNSKLQNISSTNNSLKEVVLTNGTTSSSSSAYTTTVKDQGNLTVLGTAPNDGDAALPGSAGVHDSYGFNDVRLIDGSAFKGQLNISAQFSEASIDKYVKLSDTNANPAADTVAVEYKGGSGNDTLVVDIDGVTAASRSSIVSGREDFTFKVEGGAGDDKITLTVNQNAGGSENWYYNQNLNNNITIDAGAGNDVIRTPGAGDKKIDAGAGNDVVYSDNSGSATYSLNDGAVNSTDKGAWVFNTAGQTIDALDDANRDLNDIRSDVNDSYDLFKATVQVSFKGLESRVITLANTTTYKTTDLEINQAIKDAINNDAVLKNLLVAKDGPANSLIVESLIDGTMTAADLTVTLAAPTVNLTAAELAAVNAAWKTTHTSGQEITAMGVTVAGFNTKADYSTELAQDDNGFDVVGAASFTTADNFITVGTGDDVVVLGTTLGNGVEWSSNEVVIFGAGFGTDTIVNYAATGNGIDHLDFTAILGGAAGAVTAAESIGVARTVAVTTESAANDTADEIKALYNAIDATTSTNASKHLYVAAGTGVNVGKAKVYSVVDGAADNDVTVTLEGTVDLGSVAWSGLTLTNFQVPSATSEGPSNLAATNQVALATTGALYGTTQNDVLNGAAATVGIFFGNFLATGGDGDDTITGSATVNSFLSGGNGNDTITGGAGNDSLEGNAGNDAISGGAGADTITGGTGADTLTGGAGADKFVFAAGDSNSTTTDSIVDYQTGEQIEHDTLNVTANSTAVVAAAGKAGLAGAGAAATFNAADTTLAQHITAIEAALADTTHTAGEAAHWQEGADTYVFITDGVAGVGADDVIVKLVGIDSTNAAFDVLTIAGNNLTLA